MDAVAEQRVRIGFCCGAFDLLHAGHVLMLKDAKAQCDVLVVGLHVDPSIERPSKNTPVQSLEERLLILAANRYVDRIVVYRTERDLVELLRELRPDVRILGSDWQEQAHTGRELQIPVYFHRRDHPWSTSELRKRVYEAEKAKRAKDNGADVL